MGSAPPSPSAEHRSRRRRGAKVRPVIAPRVNQGRLMNWIDDLDAVHQEGVKGDDTVYTSLGGLLDSRVELRIMKDTLINSAMTTFDEETWAACDMELVGPQ